MTLTEGTDASICSTCANIVERTCDHDTREAEYYPIALTGSSDTLIALAIGSVLFVVFERKRIAVWRAKFASTRLARRRSRNSAGLAEALATLGFFDGLSTDDARRVRAAVASRGYGGIFDHPWRVLNADDEELAEGNVRAILELWTPSLARLGLAQFIGDSRFSEGGAHFLELPNETIVLLHEDEAEADRPGKRHGLSWGVVGARLLQRLNEELRLCARPDRLYSVYGGNDALAIALTPAMLAAILRSPGIQRGELPYVRTTEWPHFGMDISDTRT